MLAAALRDDPMTAAAAATTVAVNLLLSRADHLRMRVLHNAVPHPRGSGPRLIPVRDSMQQATRAWQITEQDQRRGRRDNERRSDQAQEQRGDRGR
ncbi:hypothetical protein [Nonomuraea diastatica]|uniref:Uncharacterized protein n=1 Tax=Nonomuraea diastatica TaxID=1848329 RepID=A0A4R4WIP7_9ACTN|nr:hypothetical protein [Nonomuraea diastatica]TDD18939.1 hypothetical protein E1294_22740 [Nonomuraea diastatica]